MYVVLLGLWRVLRLSVSWETILGSLPIPESLNVTSSVLVSTVSP